MKVQLVKFGEAIRQIEVKEGITIAEFLESIGNPHKNGYTVRVSGEPIGDSPEQLGRRLEPEDQVLVIPNVEGG